MYKIVIILKIQNDTSNLISSFSKNELDII